MLHSCSHSAEDFWPPSPACPQCTGASCRRLQGWGAGLRGLWHNLVWLGSMEPPAITVAASAAAAAAGMPEMVSTSWQALARGYALLAVDSLNRAPSGFMASCLV